MWPPKWEGMHHASYVCERDRETERERERER